MILSKAVGKPVRVQWMRPEDFQWSTQSPAAYSDVEIGLDAKGKMIAYQVDHYMPAMQDDRPVGAVLAGLPTMPAPNEKAEFIGSTVNEISDPWIYDGVAILMERGHGTFQVGQKASPLAVGLRDHSMRTPGQFQQNFPRELAVSEAAALAGSGRHPVPDRPRDRRTRDRGAQGGARCIGMGDSAHRRARMLFPAAKRRCAAAESR